MFSNKDSGEHRKILLEKRNFILNKLLDEKFDGGRQLDFHGDDLDKATFSNDIEMSYMLGDRKTKELKAIEEALKKLEEGTYGLCEMCEKEINKERIIALPLTQYCIDCQSELEIREKFFKNV